MRNTAILPEPRYTSPLFCIQVELSSTFAVVCLSRDISLAIAHLKYIYQNIMLHDYDYEMVLLRHTLVQCIME